VASSQTSATTLTISYKQMGRNDYIESLGPGHASLCTMQKDQRCVTSS